MSRERASDSRERVLSASYIEKHKNKKDLVRRLRTVVEALGDDDIDPNSPDYPGLDSLANALVEDRFLSHPDKEVRLHTVLACMEIFYLYAPDPPWYEAEILRVFSQLIRQLANLAHCTSQSQPNFKHYFRLLEQLSEIKIGCVLVELTRTLDSDKIGGGTGDSPSSEEALEMLADLIRTILHSVHIDHPAEVASHAASAVSACIEEFDGTVPIPVLDELLACVGDGPIVHVTDPAAVEAHARAAKKKEKPAKMPPMQKAQSNPSYMVASKVIRGTVDRISTPIASLLNGLMNGDSNVVSQTGISSAESAPAASSSSAFPAAPEKQESADVWAIVYELHRIAPQILTTVIGTVTNSLQSPDLDLRFRVTKLLGRLFYAPKSNIGVEFNRCFTEWVRRSNDAEPKVRQSMAKYLVLVLSNKGSEESLAKEASEALVNMIEHDPSLDVRLQAMHQVCDLAVKAKNKEKKNGESHAQVPPRLLRAVGNRVRSKNKTERRDALTGLSQIYFHNYLQEKLKQVQSGGDDCDIGIILHALHGGDGDHGHSNKKKRRSLGNGFEHSADLDDEYGWIPQQIFKCACFADSTDPELRNRLIQVIDDVLLGSGASRREEGRHKQSLTATSKAVGLALITNSLRDETDDNIDSASSDSIKFMRSLLTQRAKLQRALERYLNSRIRLKQCTPDTEEALTMEAEAMECLEAVAKLMPPVTSSGPSSSATDVQTILQKLHSARDKHIFRILATIAIPTHSASARARAFDELPKRTKSLGTATAAWVKTLVRRCAMGNFINAENIRHCILLAQECFHEGDLPGCMSFLLCVKMGVISFRTLCGDKEAFGTLVELFGECSAASSATAKREIEESGIVTMLSEILAAAAPSGAQRFVGEKDTGKAKELIDSDLEKQLLNLCIREGTPQQARYSVYTMSSLLRSIGQTDADAFGALLKALTSTTKLSLSSGGRGFDNAKIISILTALAALSECAPHVFNETSFNGRGKKAIRFALETVLLGRSDSIGDIELEEDDDSSDDEDDDPETPSSTKSRRRQSMGRSSSEGLTKHVSPGNKINVLEDSALSLACRRACAAIELLCSHIRSTVSNLNTTPSLAHSADGDNDKQKAEAPSPQHIQQVFSILAHILRDNGLPPSSRDRRNCRSRQDRAALRQCAAIHLLRLCDGRLKLEWKYLTPSMWHVLGGAFLDEERAVREAVMEQLSTLLLGTLGPVAPSLRLVALLCLCVDGDHGGGHAGANGNAANVGRRAGTTKTASLQCIRLLRGTFDATLAQCRARGREAEKKFENQFKMKIMPEFAVPYAFHLLSFRRETPSAGGAAVEGMTLTEPEDDAATDEEGRYKILKKRLNWLLEPLVQSLGDSADNISFLLRMTEMLGNHYQPTGVSRDLESVRTSTAIAEPQDTESTAKLKVICAAAREVLLSFVKQDVNLTPYPGAVQVPASLFKRLPSPARLPLSSDLPAPRIASPNDRGVESSVLRKRRESQPQALSTDSPLSDQDDTNRRSARPSASSRRGRSSSLRSVGSSPDVSKSRPPMEEASHSSVGSHRKGRVHFSPEVDDNANFFAEDDSSVQFQSHSQDDFGDLSPIRSPGTPSPLGTGTRGSKNSSGEKLTLGTTPPSILRSRDSVSSSVSSKIKRRRSSRPKRAQLRDHGKEEHRTPTSVEKRKSPSVASEGQSAKRAKRSTPVQIKVGMSDEQKPTRNTPARNSKRSSHKKQSISHTTDDSDDAFDFPDEDKENESFNSSRMSKRSRAGANKKSKAPTKRSRIQSKHTMKSPGEVSLGSVSSPNSSESSSITKLKRNAASSKAGKRKVSAKAPRRSRRSRG